MQDGKKAWQEKDAETAEEASPSEAYTQLQRLANTFSGRCAVTCAVTSLTLARFNSSLSQQEGYSRMAPLGMYNAGLADVDGGLLWV